MTTLTVQTEMQALNAMAGDGRVLRWPNPDNSIVVLRVVVDVTNQAAAGATCSFGSAPNDNTASANLIDRLPIDAVGTSDNITNKGANGRTCLILRRNEFITGTATGNVAGLQGFAYITYARS